MGINVALKPNLSIPEPRAKRKPKIQALDLLVGAELKLKPGFCYGLVGRNGTGKSSQFAHRCASVFHLIDKQYLQRSFVRSMTSLSLVYP